MVGIQSDKYLINYFYANIQALSCDSIGSLTTSYLLTISFIYLEHFRAFPYTHSCSLSNSLLNTLMASKDSFIYIGIPSSTSANRFTLQKYSWYGLITWKMDSSFDGEVVGLQFGNLDTELLVVARQ